MERENKENIEGINGKRARDESTDSGSDSIESKLRRVDSANSESIASDLDQNVAELSEFDDDRVNSANSGVNSPEAKRIQDELLNELDDSDEPAFQGLDSVIKSFEDEILVPAPATEATFPGGSQPDLGYLLEASDDELGLPPTLSGEEESVCVADLEATPPGSGFDEIYGFEDQLPNYDSFEFGIGVESDGNSFNGGYNEGEDFVALGGLFNHSDENVVPADISGSQWQAESLSAL